jgi:SAM-dependent methyltransferase
MSIREWDEKYLRGEGADAPPEALVVQTAERLRPAKALDLACGTGRHAIWLAEHGWDVTAVDGSAIAIEILRARSPAVHAIVADLEKGEYQIEPSVWNLIVMTKYLQRDLFDAMKRGVAPGGIAIVTCLAGEGRYRVRPGELADTFRGWEIVHYREAVLAEVVARKRE